MLMLDCGIQIDKSSPRIRFKTMTDGERERRADRVDPPVSGLGTHRTSQLGKSLCSHDGR
jgi:hypothetical protein